jgi:purine-binding chemotaxis protein CheW
MDDTSATPQLAPPRQALEVLTFGLGGEIFAMEAAIVREILELVTVTAVPNAKPFVNGLINVRGRVVPLADPRLKFGMEITPATVDTRIIVIEIDIDGEPVIVGVLADKVFEVTEIGAAAIEETPRIGMKWRPEFIRCIGKRRDEFIIVPDLCRIFSTTDGLSGGTGVNDPASAGHA